MNISVFGKYFLDVWRRCVQSGVCQSRGKSPKPKIRNMGCEIAPPDSGTQKRGRSVAIFGF